jgi:hypothetical protein
MADDGVPPCECCGKPDCDCEIALADDSDPLVGYFAENWFCFTHQRRVG